MTTMKKMTALTRMASRLAAADGHEERYKILLQTFHEAVGGDAVALLRKEGKALNLVACRGLSPDALHRRFQLEEHPRLDVICHSKEAVVFPSDCSMPDPYDGWIGSDGSAAARVHSCMGLPLVVNRRLIGALTADALAPDLFARLDLSLIQALSVFAAAEMHTTRLIEALELKTEKMCQVSRRLVQDARGVKGGELIGTSEVIRRLHREVELIARSDFSVLITGETGAGKEVVARAVHAASRRRELPLLYLNCATLPHTLVESELFGHVRGAFTGAVADRAGKLELADEGTLFIDEIGELPLDVQPRLLRFLQTGEVQRVGSNRTRILKARLLAATNRNLADAVQKERFRADLFHRINVYPIHVPPLREHPEDIPLIAGRFSEVIRRQLGVGPVRFRPDTLSAMQSYPWPGNVRELENVIARAVLRASGGRRHAELVVVAPPDLGLEPPASGILSERMRTGGRMAPATPMRVSVAEFQRDLIRSAVKHNDGNWAAAARELGINRSNLHKLAKRLGIKPGTGL
jgi:anaerobic nitric oxide reductase transcription regulator